MTANPHRGECVVRLDADYVIRPDFEAMAAIEEQLGPVLALARTMIGGGDIGLKQAAVIVCEGLKAAGRARGDATAQAITLRRVMQLVFDAGVAEVQAALVPFLEACVLGGGAPGNAPPMEPATP